MRFSFVVICLSTSFTGSSPFASARPFNSATIYNSDIIPIAGAFKRAVEQRFIDPDATIVFFREPDFKAGSFAPLRIGNVLPGQPYDLPAGYAGEVSSFWVGANHQCDFCKDARCGTTGPDEVLPGVKAPGIQNLAQHLGGEWDNKIRGYRCFTTIAGGNSTTTRHSTAS